MFRDWLERLLPGLFPPIPRREALQIATRLLGTDCGGSKLICHDTKPSSCNIYGAMPEPCWYVYAPWNGEGKTLMIRSSRVILIGKRTGTVHYDGSAGDEG